MMFLIQTTASVKTVNSRISRLVNTRSHFNSMGTEVLVFQTLTELDVSFHLIKLLCLSCYPVYEARPSKDSIPAFCELLL